MAYKYKLVKETELGTSKDIKRFPSLSPEQLERMGAVVDLDARKEFVVTPANTPRSEELENIIRYSLEEDGFAPEDIDNYMEFIYIERNNNVGGEFGDTPLNEDNEDPLSKKMRDLLTRFKKEDEKSGERTPDSNAKNTFKDAIKEAILKRLKNNRNKPRS